MPTQVIINTFDGGVVDATLVSATNKALVIQSGKDVCLIERNRLNLLTATKPEDAHVFVYELVNSVGFSNYQAWFFDTYGVWQNV